MITDIHVLLDAGHGGIVNGNYVTPGKRSPKWSDLPQLFEGVQNREIVSLIKIKLTALGIKFTEFKKPSSLSIEENNTLLWAKQIFKTKPNHEVDAELKTKIKTVFHHLTKEELIEKLK